MAKSASQEDGRKVVVRNRRARLEYDIEETIEAGLVLVGSEVKSLRAGQADISDAYAIVRQGELFLMNVHIAEYDKARRFGHATRRERKLLVHKKLLVRLGIRIHERGYTLVALEIYFKGGWAKVLLGLGRGRKLHDQRQEIRRRESERELSQVRRERG